jgi:hypothetical protein
MSIFLHEVDARASFITIGRMPKRVGPKGGQESVVTVLVDASSAVESGRSQKRVVISLKRVQGNSCGTVRPQTRTSCDTKGSESESLPRVKEYPYLVAASGYFAKSLSI